MPSGPYGYFHTPQWHRPLPARGQAADLPALAPPSAEQTRLHNQRAAKSVKNLLTKRQILGIIL
jgi:hypothetical protein